MPLEPGLEVPLHRSLTQPIMFAGLPRVLEYYLLAAVVGVLIPFGILPQTKFLAEKAIGAIVSAGIKLMVLAFVLAVAEPTLSNIRFSARRSS